MKLTDAFERVVIINLPFKIARKEKLKKHLEDVDVVDLDKVVWERAICGDWAPAPSWFGAGNGAWGCLMSHVRVAHDAIHDSVESYCVLEDDVIFHDRAPEMLEKFMSEVPSDWGQIYLGGQFLHREPKQISPWVVKPHNVNRTHAFALDRHAIPQFLQHVLWAPDYFEPKLDQNQNVEYIPNDFHIDHQLGRAHEREDWPVYAPTWWLAGQEEGTSNISGNSNERMWWHWRDRGHTLPFFYIDHKTSDSIRDLASKSLHVGFNTFDNSLIDVGLTRSMNVKELEDWLYMIAGESLDRWRLPGLEIPKDQPELKSKIEDVWEPGIFKLTLDRVKEFSDYPFNGQCGGLPH